MDVSYETKQIFSLILAKNYDTETEHGRKHLISVILAPYCFTFKGNFYRTHVFFSFLKVGPRQFFSVERQKKTPANTAFWPLLDWVTHRRRGEEEEMGGKGSMLREEMAKLCVYAEREGRFVEWTRG